MGKDFYLGLTLIKAKRGRGKKISRLKLVSAVRAGKRIKWKYLKDGWFVENSQLSVGNKRSCQVAAEHISPWTLPRQGSDKPCRLFSKFSMASMYPTILFFFF